MTLTAGHDHVHWVWDSEDGNISEMSLHISNQYCKTNNSRPEVFSHLEKNFNCLSREVYAILLLPFVAQFYFVSVLSDKKSPCTVQAYLPYSCGIDVLPRTAYSVWLLTHYIHLCEQFLVSLAPGFSSTPISPLLLINSVSAPVISKSRMETDGSSQKTLSTGNYTLTCLIVCHI